MEEKINSALQNGDFGVLKELSVTNVSEILRQPINIVRQALNYSIDEKIFDVAKLIIGELKQSKKAHSLKTEFLWKFIHRAVENEKVSGASVVLVESVRNNTTELVKFLLRHKAKVDTRNERGETPLHFVCLSGSFSCLEVLINFHADVNARTRDCARPLQIAAERGHLQIASYLLNHGASVNDKNDKISPLHLAIKNGHQEIAELFLNRRADINVKDENEERPFYYAVRYNQVPLIKLFLEYGCNINAVIGAIKEKPIHVAVANQCMETIIFLLDRGADINAISTNHTTPLHIATRYDYPEIVEYLVKKGADTRSKEKATMATPLHLAAEHGHLQCASILLKYGADINERGFGKYTPLHTAMWHKQEKTIDFLLDQGADITLRDVDERSCFHFACKFGLLRAVERLLDMGVDANLVAEFGPFKEFPLPSAIVCRHPEVALALIENEADINLFEGSCTLINPSIHYSSNIDYNPNAYHYAGFNKNVDVQVMIEIIVKQVVKLKFQNRVVRQEYTDDIHKKELLKEFCTRCEEEMKKMKIETIHNTDISLFDFFTTQVEKLVCYTRNEENIVAFSSEDLETKFPLYAVMIRRHMKRIVKLRDFLDQCKRFLSILFPKLPHVCVDIVFESLNKIDGKNLIRAFKGDE